MTRENKIFLGIIGIIIIILGFINFEVAIDSHNMAITNQNKIDSLEYRISFLEEMQKPDTIKIKMASDLKLKDDGTRYSSFVLTRATMPVSILIETAYMPNPDEYLKLTNKHFQQKTAKTIANGLEDYLCTMRQR